MLLLLQPRLQRSTTSVQEGDENGGDEPLPAGWAMSVAPNGRVFYINHNDRITSWVSSTVLSSFKRPVAWSLLPLLKELFSRKEAANEHIPVLPQACEFMMNGLTEFA